jgi:hypothetical protein
MRADARIGVDVMPGPYFKGYDAPIDPSEVHFTAVEACGCDKCIFKAQRTVVCHRVAMIAEEKGLPDCTLGFIYVLDKSDARQLRIKSESATDCESATPSNTSPRGNNV